MSAPGLGLIVLHPLDDTRNAGQLTIEPKLDSARPLVLGVGGTQNMRHRTSAEVFAHLLVLDRQPRDHPPVRENGVRVGIGRDRQELVAVLRVLGHGPDLRVVEMKHVGDRLDDGVFRTTRLTPRLDDGVRQIHGIESVFPERNRLGKRRILPVRPVNRSSWGGKRALERIVRIRRGSPLVEMGPDELLPCISGQRDQQRDRRPESPSLATHRHDVNAFSCSARTCRRFGLGRC